MDFIAFLRDRVAELVDQRTAARAELDAALATPTAEQRDLTETETEAFNVARDAVAQLDAQLDETRSRLAELEAIEERQAAEDAARPTRPVQVRGEAHTYRPEAAHGFLGDLYAAAHRTGDFRGAEERLARHQAESVEQRAVAVAAMAGTVPPQYLVDQFAPIARAGRPFLNALNALPLPPDGVSFPIPKGTTGATAAMTAEAAAFTDGNVGVTDLATTVNLVTGAVDISRTLFMRGGAVVDQIIFPDVIAASEVALNVSALVGNGTAPQHKGILGVSGVNAVTWTEGSPTVSKAWPKIADAIQRINSGRFAPATVIVMHPRRWGWITAALDTTGRPAFDFSTVPPNSVVGLGVAAEYGQVVGTVQGLPVVTDASIPTNLGTGENEDTILIVRSIDVVYWEDAIMQFTFEQALATAPGQVRLAAGRFSLFQAGRYPTGISVIGGTGLVTPTF